MSKVMTNPYLMLSHPIILVHVYDVGDVTKMDDLLKAFEGADCVWHIAAAVGPFHPKAGIFLYSSLIYIKNL